MSELNEKLGEIGLQTYTIVLTLSGFKTTEHKDPKLVKEYDMENIKDYGEIIFFEGNSYIQHFKENDDNEVWVVMIVNNEYQFETKDEAIKYLYFNFFLPECTDIV